MRRVGGFSKVDEEDLRDVEGREEEVDEDGEDCEAPILMEVGPTRGRCESRNIGNGMRVM